MWCPLFLSLPIHITSLLAAPSLPIITSSPFSPWLVSILVNALESSTVFSPADKKLCQPHEHPVCVSVCPLFIQTLLDHQTSWDLSPSSCCWCLISVEWSVSFLPVCPFSSCDFSPMRLSSCVSVCVLVESFLFPGLQGGEQVVWLWKLLGNLSD